MARLLWRCKPTVGFYNLNLTNLLFDRWLIVVQVLCRVYEGEKARKMIDQANARTISTASSGSKFTSPRRSSATHSGS